jgi:hypothetical protein
MQKMITSCALENGPVTKSLLVVFAIAIGLVLVSEAILAAGL